MEPEDHSEPPSESLAAAIAQRDHALATLRVINPILKLALEERDEARQCAEEMQRHILATLGPGYGAPLPWNRHSQKT